MSPWTKRLASKEKTRVESSSDYDRCKTVTAKAAGYDAKSLKGDGDPVQEPSYKSFYFEGRGGDLFFCEVHSGGKYKVKAALKGNFPFKYIAQGSFD